MSPLLQSRQRIFPTPQKAPRTPPQSIPQGNPYSDLYRPTWVLPILESCQCALACLPESSPRLRDSFMLLCEHSSEFFDCWLTFHCVNTGQCIHSLDGHLGFYHSLTHMNKVAVNILAQVFWWTLAPISVGDVPRSGMNRLCNPQGHTDWVTPQSWQWGFKVGVGSQLWESSWGTICPHWPWRGE